MLNAAAAGHSKPHREGAQSLTFFFLASSFSAFLSCFTGLPILDGRVDVTKRHNQGLKGQALSEVTTIHGQSVQYNRAMDTRLPL